MMGREVSFTNLDEETYSSHQDKYRALSTVHMSSFMNSLHRVFGGSFGIIPPNLVTSINSPATFPSTNHFNFDYTSHPLHEVQGRYRNAHPFKNDIGYFPTPDFQYSQCQENIPEFYLTSHSGMGTSPLESVMEEGLHRPPPVISSTFLQPPISSSFQYPSPFPGTYTFFVPVYPCYVLIPTVQPIQTNTRN